MFPDEHASRLETLEQGFHNGNNEALDASSIGLAFRPTHLLKNHTLPPSAFIDKYKHDVQNVFSHYQHHWHEQNEKGERKPLPYCTPKTKRTKKDG